MIINKRTSNRRTFTAILSVLLYFLFMQFSYALVVRNIMVHGNKKISSQAIIEHLGIPLRKDFPDSQIDIAVKNIFAMGYFSDAKIKQNGSTLHVYVREYSLVNQVFFEGNKKFKADFLKKAIGLKTGKSFDKAKLQSDVNAIKQLYKSAGVSDVEVSTNIVPAGGTGVNVVFHIVEEKQPTIGKIIFVGNDHFSSSQLSSVIYSRQTSLFSWFTKSDVYIPERLAIDEEALKTFYFNHGYADFRVVSSRAEMNPQTKKFELEFKLSEGAKYKFGDIVIESDVSAINSYSLYNCVDTKTGQDYNQSKVEDTVAAINDKITETGYAFARVDYHSNHNFNDHTISIIYSVKPGIRLYVERIDISGNDRTKDYVIRREFPFSEGDALNATLLKRVKRRLMQLGFFQTVDITTKPGSGPDQVILSVKVSENPTGEFSIGGGYTTGGASPGASIDLSIAENNLLGTGRQVKVAASAGRDASRNLTFSISDPYFLGYKLPVGLDLFHTQYHMNNSYKVLEEGASPHVTIPLTENLAATIVYNLIAENYDLGGSDEEQLKKNYAPAIFKASQKDWTRSSLQYGLIYNSLDNMAIPREGVYAKLMQEYAGLGGSAHYLKTYAKGSVYLPISERYDVVGLLSAGAGYLHENQKDGARVFDLFKSDTNLVRGFKYNGIGPRQKSPSGQTFFIGGSKFFNATAELQYPLPFLSQNFGMRGAAFVDAGSVFDNPYQAELKEPAVTNNNMVLRASAGLSLIWASPLGPLRFDYALPLKKENGDLLESFNFGMSTRF